MNVFFMTVIRGDGPEWEEESIMMDGDNMSACSGYNSATRVKDTSRTGKSMSLMGCWRIGAGGTSRRSMLKEKGEHASRWCYEVGS